MWQRVAAVVLAGVLVTGCGNNKGKYESSTFPISPTVPPANPQKGPPTQMPGADVNPGTKTGMPPKAPSKPGKK